jgi:hypothetical protein
MGRSFRPNEDAKEIYPNKDLEQCPSFLFHGSKLHIGMAQ